MADVPVIVHSVHGWSFNDYQNPLKRILYTVLEKFTSRITSHFFLESKKHIKIGEEKGLFRKSGYSLLLPGIYFSEIDNIYNSKGAIIPEEFNKQRTAEKKIITMIACFKYQKAPLDFVRAAELVIKKKENIYFFMVGDGILRPEIENLIREKNLQDYISLLGWRKDIPPILFASDLLVLTSLWEGMPTVLPMATRAGIPVVANNIDGCREFITEGENGWLSEPGNPESTAANIIRALNDFDIRKRIDKLRFNKTEHFEIGYTTGLQANLYIKLLGKL
jgi:glycosyltransferase involved in cell wall biosynthesis